MIAVTFLNDGFHQYIDFDDDDDDYDHHDYDDDYDDDDDVSISLGKNYGNAERMMAFTFLKDGFHQYIHFDDDHDHDVDDDDGSISPGKNKAMRSV